MRTVEYLYRLREAGVHENLHEWAYLYSHPQAELCLKVIAARLTPEEREIFLQKHARRRASMAKHIERIVAKKPLLDANRLIAQGVAPGKEMGKLLKEGERLAIENNLENPEEVLSYLQKTSIWRSI